MRERAAAAVDLQATSATRSINQRCTIENLNVRLMQVLRALRAAQDFAGQRLVRSATLMSLAPSRTHKPLLLIFSRRRPLLQRAGRPDYLAEGRHCANACRRHNVIKLPLSFFAWRRMRLGDEIHSANGSRAHIAATGFVAV